MPDIGAAIMDIVHHAILHPLMVAPAWALIWMRLSRYQVVRIRDGPSPRVCMCALIRVYCVMLDLYASCRTKAASCRALGKRLCVYGACCSPAVHLSSGGRSAQCQCKSTMRAATAFVLQRVELLSSNERLRGPRRQSHPTLLQKLMTRAQNFALRSAPTAGLSWFQCWALCVAGSLSHFNLDTVFEMGGKDPIYLWVLSTGYFKDAYVELWGLLVIAVLSILLVAGYIFTNAQVFFLSRTRAQVLVCLPLLH